MVLLPVMDFEVPGEGLGGLVVFYRENGENTRNRLNCFIW
jgi:hypothetical protein